MNAFLPTQQRVYEPSTFTAKSGLPVVVRDNEWQLLATTSRGWKINLGWIWRSSISSQDRFLLLDVYVQYARTKAANTTVTVIYGTKPYLKSGIPELTELRAKWSGLPTSHKKALNQFFGTLSKLGHREYEYYHTFTRNHLNKGSSNVYDPKKGALSEQEYETFCRSLNLHLRGINWQQKPALSFYKHGSHFSRIKAAVSTKLLTAIVRRPIQVCALKWCDLIPVGERFYDSEIDPSCEVGNTGNNKLQIRVFHVKAGGRSWRTTPEKYPIALSFSMSETLIHYKHMFMHGIKVLLEKHGCFISQQELVNVVSMMPIFHSSCFFEMEISSLNDLIVLFTERSRALHLSEASLSKYLIKFPAQSSRVDKCTVTPNRLRHTVLTRGAQRGLSATVLAKITGVTVPGARHYVDLDYKSRLMIDDLYLGSEFLAEIFSNPLEQTSEQDDRVFDDKFNTIGGLRDKGNCTTCPSIMGRPTGCYGCGNFRPILEADHRRVLELAELKVKANDDRLLSTEARLTLEKLEKQVKWIKLTISACDQVLETRRGIK